jgi:PAS domain S-box-containing protein
MSDKKKISSHADLHIAEERFSTILDTIIDGYYEVDLQGNLIIYNKQMAELYGYTPEELKGIHYTRYMSKETAAEVYRVFNEVYTTGRPSKVLDFVAIMKDGKKRFIVVSVVLMKDSKGGKIGFRGIGRDVTESNDYV